MWTCILPHRLMEIAHTTQWVIMCVVSVYIGVWVSMWAKSAWIGAVNQTNPKQAHVCIEEYRALSSGCVQLPVFSLLQEPLTHCDVIGDSTAHITPPKEGSKEALAKERYESLRFLEVFAVLNFCHGCAPTEWMGNNYRQELIFGEDWHIIWLVWGIYTSLSFR